MSCGWHGVSGGSATPCAGAVPSDFLQSTLRLKNSAKVQAERGLNDHCTLQRSAPCMIHSKDAHCRSAADVAVHIQLWRR